MFKGFTIVVKFEDLNIPKESEKASSRKYLFYIFNEDTCITFEYIRSKDESDQIRYTANQTSKRIITMIHRYFIINEGPSFLPKTYVNITIPLSKDEIDVAVIKVIYV